MDFYQDPCCGISLYRGVKVIAIIDLVTSIFSTVMYGFGFLIAIFDGDAIMSDWNDYNNNGTQILPDGSTSPSVRIGVGWIIFSFLAIALLNGLYILLARYLLHAVQERNAVKLQRWFDFTVVILAVRLLGYIPGLFIGGSPLILFGLMWCMYSTYSLWVVHSFRKKLLTEGESSLLRDSVFYSHNAKI